MMNQIRGSMNYNTTSTSQIRMPNQYPSYFPHPVRQQFSPYDAYDSHANMHYTSHSGTYINQQPPVGPIPYGNSQIQSSPYGSVYDLNSRGRSNDYSNYNMNTPINYLPSTSFDSNITSSMAPTRPLLEQQTYFNLSKQRQDYVNDNSHDLQYSSNKSTLSNPPLKTPIVSMHRSTYQNEVNSSPGKVSSNIQRMVFPSPTSTNTMNSESSNYPSSYNTHSGTCDQSLANQFPNPINQEIDNNLLKTESTQSSLSKSPSCTSISSYIPDDADSSNSSFSDTTTSVSNEKPSLKRKMNQTTSIETFDKLREMGNEPERNLFVDRLQKLWEEKHVTCRKLPCIARQTIDLYRFYTYVREQNGFEQFSKVAKSRHWHHIASKLNIPHSSTAPFHLKQKYVNLKLFHYECQYDRDGIDPDITLEKIEKAQQNRRKNITTKNGNKSLLVDDQSVELSNEALSIRKNRMNSSLSQKSQTAVSNVEKPSQSSSLNSDEVSLRAPSQLQQVPTLSNQWTKPSSDVSNLNAMSKSTFFPIGSVEATTVSSNIKRRKLTAKDIPSIDSMKILMSLRGGLLAETTWALDTINIILSDDQTHTSLQLKQMPGILQALVDIYIKCLTQLFDEFKIEHETISNQSKEIYPYRQENDSVIYRVESNYLNKYQGKYNKHKNIIFADVYDDQGNLRNNPEDVLDLQNVDDYSYIQTHFDPIHEDDNYYENLYYGHHYSNNNLSLNENNHTKSYDENSKHSLNITENNRAFIQRYTRKSVQDEISSDRCSRNSESLSQLNHKEENDLTLFNKYSSGYDQICARCICVSSILRNLSFIPNNDTELVRCSKLISVLARILLIGHNVNHPNKIHTLSNEQTEESLNNRAIKYDSSKNEDTTTSSFSLFECLTNIRENTLVTLANIAGLLILDTYDSLLINNLINGLLYWSTCENIDPSQSSQITVQHLSIEILTKLSGHDMNMDFILASPSISCITSLFHILTDWLNVDNINRNVLNSYSNISQSQAYIQREFAVVLLNALLRCDSYASHIIAHIPYTISLIIDFLEDYEKKTNDLIIRYGSDYVLRLMNTPETEKILLTTNDMLTRAATCLLSMISYKDNIKIMKKYEDRILNLSISNVIDGNIGRILTDILHNCSIHTI